MKKIGFVAMKFEGDIWKDKKYLIISEVLAEVGLQAVRADGIRTSGASMDEVAKHLEEASLVVVDLSGQSHNVSYELGFCHGVGRNPQEVILLCKEGVEIPFNYAHYRYNKYRDLRHLRTVLRYRLGISTPLTDDQLGHAFSFTYSTASMYGTEVAYSVLAALRSIRFTGRCEYYAGEPIPGIYVVGLALKSQSPKGGLKGEWWQKLSDLIEKKLQENDSGCSLDRIGSELAEVRAFRQTLLGRGVAEFEDGEVRQLLNPGQVDSWFSAAVEEKLQVGSTEPK
ncbi:hypothetical protein [Streptomyces sp. IB201691-2A2]|uniref:hypothetical protein n=1 Tax=Streptomyces sp. IB201691-2A2 TaxID=2561920 RepID=UPI00117C990A|nr:hypothetical protein [Streptomyces sp. IB201691-2A2]TRO69449.1 hypothetical protein E4K73_02000 [Streptomyces sp. IB201691-2A2]